MSDSIKKYEELNVEYEVVKPYIQNDTSGNSIEDSIVKSVINKFKSRSEVGIKKYGVTLDRKDLKVTDWIEHSIQEQMDNILYLTKLKKELNERGL